MRKDIRSLADVNEIVSRDTGIDAFGYVHMSFHNGTQWFEQEGLLVECKPMGRDIYTIHTYGTNRKSIQEKKEFFIECGKYLVDNGLAKEIIITVPKEHLRLRLVVNSFATPCGETPGHLLYVFSEDNRRTLCPR